jgi:hypothetical protein
MTNDRFLKGFWPPEAKIDGEFRRIPSLDFSLFLWYLFLLEPGGGL